MVFSAEEERFKSTTPPHFTYLSCSMFSTAAAVSSNGHSGVLISQPTAAVPKLTTVTEPFFHSTLFFQLSQALPSWILWDLVRITKVLLWSKMTVPRRAGRRSHQRQPIAPQWICQGTLRPHGTQFGNHCSTGKLGDHWRRLQQQQTLRERGEAFPPPSQCSGLLPLLSLLPLMSSGGSPESSCSHYRQRQQ